MAQICLGKAKNCPKTVKTSTGAPQVSIRTAKMYPVTGKTNPKTTHMVHGSIQLSPTTAKIGPRTASTFRPENLYSSWNSHGWLEKAESGSTTTQIFIRSAQTIFGIYQRVPRIFHCSFHTGTDWSLNTPNWPHNQKNNPGQKRVSVKIRVNLPAKMLD